MRILLLLFPFLTKVSGHGRLTVPAARNAAWKDAPTAAIRNNVEKDYNLDGLAAGGPGVVPLYGHGVCGDKVGEEQVCCHKSSLLTAIIVYVELIGSCYWWKVRENA
jgi:hypothetical protein